MTTELRTTGTLTRQLDLAVPIAQVDKDAGERLRRLARTVKMPGFRPGKVPMRMIQQSYGGQVNAEVLGDAVSKAFSDAVAKHQLRVAGQPAIDRREGAPDSEYGFTASFEVYPDIQVPDVATVSVERLQCEVGDAEIDRTIEILRKQRVSWEPADRPAAQGDRVTIDFLGRIDGEPFDGGSADGFAFVLGEGRMLGDFETGVTGQSADARTTFPVQFPPEYSVKELAGKSAEFEVHVRQVDAPVLPEVDEEFARSLGVADGSIATMRSDIAANLNREVAQRLRARIKNSVMDGLSAKAIFDLPAALVTSERETLVENARRDLAGRGMDMKDIPIPDDAFREQAERRVRLGLLVAEIVKAEKLQAKPEQIRAQIEEFAQAYENPAEVVRHYFSDREQLSQVEALVIEQNVVDWVLAKAQVEDKAIPFEDLMGG